MLLLVVTATVAPAAVGKPASPGATGAIESVVVFADRARVTRARTAPCEHGKARAAFDRLPASLDTRTLRGEVREQAEVIGLAGDLVNEQEAADPRARTLETERRKIETEIRAKEASKATIAAELEDMGAYGELFAATLTEEIRNPRPNTPAWARTLDAFQTRRAARLGEQRQLDIALRAHHLEIDKVDRQFRRLGGGGTRAYRTATVIVDCRTLAEITARVSYVVPGATWQPEYDVDFSARSRGKTGPGTARLTVGAVVRQSTGEDWDGVRLMLSTAKPKLGAEAPQPAPLIVDGYEQNRDRVLVQAQERRDQIHAGGRAGQTGPQAAGLEDKGNAFVLSLPHRVTIAADGRPVWSPVDVIETQATVKLVATPKLDQHVYQVVVLKNPAAYPLIEGRVRGYRGGSYVGDSQLRYRGVGEPFEVSLGLDEELKIERKTLDDKDTNPAFLSSTKHMVSVFRNELTNRAAGSETIELRESIPVSKIDDVKVELLGNRTTSGFQLDPARGFVTWPVVLKSGEKKNVDLGYTIHLPDNWQVGGR